MEGRRVGEGGDMTGKSPRGGGFFCGILAGLSSFSFGVTHCRGHRVAGGFGHGGQDSFRYPGARQPDRMLLASWEVSRFG